MAQGVVLTNDNSLMKGKIESLEAHLAELQLIEQDMKSDLDNATAVVARHDT